MTKTDQKEFAHYYIPLAIAILGAAITWGVFSQRIANAEQQITDMKVQYVAIQTSVVQTQIDVAIIKTDVSFIKSKYK